MPESKPAFEKVGECLYRYAPNGKYYARFESYGREVRRSLGTTDRALAKRKLLDLQRTTARTTGQGDKLTLAELCGRYMATVQSQAPKTIYRKEAIAARIKVDWPGGANVAISKVVQSQISAWLASYDFGVPSYNLHLLFIRAAFDLAVADKLLADSPVAGLKIKKAKKPIRKTPTFDEFLAIVADIRAMAHNADATDSGDFVEFIGLAGLGQAEATALTWGDIDWKTSELRRSVRKPVAASWSRFIRSCGRCSKRCSPCAEDARRATKRFFEYWTPRRRFLHRASGSGWQRTRTGRSEGYLSHAAWKGALT